jgi:gamma-glutamyltranspeptidase / glutathione hydrolase
VSGSTQRIITNVIDFNMTIQEAIAATRFNHLEDLKVGFAPGIPESTVDELKRRGHQLVSGNPESFRGAHAIMIHPESGAFIGGSDPRKGGCALGF